MLTILAWFIAGIIVFVLLAAVVRRIGRGMERLANDPYNDDYGI